MTTSLNSTTPDWASFNLDSAPVVVLGERKWNKQLVAKRLPVHEDAHEVLREAPRATLTLLANMSAIPNSSAVHPEFGEEYLWIDQSTFSGSGKDAPGAGLVQLTSDPSRLPVLDDAEFEELNYSFYGLSFDTPTGAITFIRKANPRQAINRGSRFFKFQHALKRVEQPDLVLDSDIDAVVVGGCVAVLRRSSADILLSDVGFSTRHVDYHVGELMEVASATLPLSAGSSGVLSSIAKRKVSIAKRLPLAIDRIREFAVTGDQFDEILVRHEIDTNDFHGTEGGVIDLTMNNVEVFLDIIEGRYYPQDITGEKMRADRYRPRTS